MTASAIAAAEKESAARIERLLKERETADMIGFAANTLAQYRHSGKVKIPYIVIGGAIRYRLSDIESFLESCRVGEDGISPAGVPRRRGGPGRPRRQPKPRPKRGTR
jgi:hypothetical protein